MATPQKPWPQWAAAEYYEMRRAAKRITAISVKAQQIGNKNVYAVVELLNHLLRLGHSINTTCKRLDLERQGRWPNWAYTALVDCQKYGKHIAGGARHGLDGIDQHNWKMVGLGLGHCLDYAGRVEAALLEGPAPLYVSVVDEIEALLEEEEI
jgi:hypothetical protein